MRKFETVACMRMTGRQSTNCKWTNSHANWNGRRHSGVGGENPTTPGMLAMSVHYAVKTNTKTAFDTRSIFHTQSRGQKSARRDI